MPGKLDRRRARERRQRRGILTLWGSGRSVEDIARRTGTSPRVVGKVLEGAGIKHLISQEQQQQSNPVGGNHERT
jgi:hypothetical protein